LDVIIDEKLIERSAELGKYFIEKIRSLRSPYFVEVRGRGLWIAIVLNQKARPFCEALMKKGLLCKETHENIVRLAPPLIITKEEIDWACERLKEVF